MSEDERNERHGRLGRLFAALVGTEADVPATGEDERRADEAEPGAASRLDLDALAQKLANSTDPFLVLRRLVDDVRARAASAEAGDAPSALETHLAERLQEAGLLESDPRETPTVRVVRPAHLGPLLSAHRRGRAQLHRKAPRPAHRGGAQRGAARHASAR